MTPFAVITTVLGYIAVLFVVAWLSGRRADNAGFFTGNRSTPWYMAAFAMIGAAISGVTFISVPGSVAVDSFSYMQMVAGFTVGQLVVAFLLIPTFYRLRVVSLYEYLDGRFGILSHHTGAWFFFVSKLLGAALRVYVVCAVMQLLVFSHYGLPFWLNALVTMLFVWLYTQQGGVKSLIWTDTLKTFCLVGSLVLSIVFIMQALGMSFAGKRALVCMKHVGLNVAADAFVNSAMTGANGGLVVVAADDPSMHSSQNEQDSRFYGKFALVPTFEPSTQQEAYEMVQAAFDFSEKYRIPVLMRLTTRMAHSRAMVEPREARPENSLAYPARTRQWVLMPGNSRVRYEALLADYARFEEEAAASPFNRYADAEDKSLGIIACGIAYNYLAENYPDGCPHPVLKISQYPLPQELVRRMASECKALLIIEEGQPVVEEALRGILPAPVEIRGRMSGELPRTGELTPDSVRTALGLAPHATLAASGIVVPRPPALCQGCGHRDMYTALTEVAGEYENAKVFSDIGCYTLGWLSPFHAIDTCVDMGASITMAKGAADAGQHPALAVIGDSTFTHSGMTGLLDAVNEGTNITVVISDNLTTGMTGGQDSAGTGRLEQICAGLGVDPAHIRVVVPLPRTREEMKAMLREEIAYDGVSVIIPRRECIQTAKRHNATKQKQ